MKKFFSLIFVSLACLIALSGLSSCDNSEKKLKEIAEKENALFPMQVGRFTFTKAELTDTSYNYHVTVPEGYYDLSNKETRDNLTAVFSAYITMSQSSDDDKKELKIRNFKGFNTTGLGFDAYSNCKKDRKLYLLLFKKGESQPFDKIVIDPVNRASVEMLLTDDPIFNVTLGGIKLVKYNDGNGVFAYSSRCYNLENPEDSEALVEQVCKSLISEMGNDPSKIRDDFKSNVMLINYEVYKKDITDVKPVSFVEITSDDLKKHVK